MQHHPPDAESDCRHRRTGLHLALAGRIRRDVPAVFAAAGRKLSNQLELVGRHRPALPRYLLQLVRLLAVEQRHEPRSRQPLRPAAHAGTGVRHPDGRHRARRIHFHRIGLGHDDCRRLGICGGGSAQSVAETAGKRRGRLKPQAEASSYRNRVFRRPFSPETKRRTIARLIFHLFFRRPLHLRRPSETLETGIHT